MRQVYGSIEELVGNTPLIRLQRTEKRLALPAKLYAKLEMFNPSGSVKDRAALWMLKKAEQEGKLLPGGTVIEPTSGNTGIGLACMAAARGYRVILVMPENMSRERIHLMRAYGAQVVLTPAQQAMQGAVERAYQLSREIPGSFLPDQFSNSANAQAHYDTTGREIWEAMQGNVDIFVAGVGTGGTLTGTGRYLKEKNPQLRVFAVEPAASPLLSGGKAGRHGIMGIGANFVPAVLDRTVLDGVLTVTQEQSCEMARHLAAAEGILCGISSGAALQAALMLAKTPENAGKQIIMLLPDTGERYLSAGLFE